MNQLYEQNKEFEFANSVYAEYLQFGPEFFKQARALNDLMNNYSALNNAGELKNKVEKNKKALTKFYKDYSIEVDQSIFQL